MPAALGRAAVAACLRALDVELLEAGREVNLTPAERLVYVTTLALGARVHNLLRLGRGGQGPVAALARFVDEGNAVSARSRALRSPAARLGYLVAHLFGPTVQSLLADPDGDVVLERMARFVTDGRGLDG